MIAALPRMIAALPRRAAFSALTLALLATLALMGAPLAGAVFSALKTGGPMTVASDTLSPPKTLEAGQVNCRKNKSPEIELQWTPTSSVYATSYEVERGASVRGPFETIATLDVSQTSYIDTSATLESSTSYAYRVSAGYLSWLSPSSGVLLSTANKACK